MVYSPVQIGNAIQAAEGKVSFPITNRYSFTDLSYLKMSWMLQSGGKKIASGHGALHQAPLTAGTAEISLSERSLDRADAFQINFAYPNGTNIVSHRF